MSIESNKPKRVGRHGKHSEKILDEDLNNLDEGITTSQEVADKRGVPVNAVSNKLHRRKEKLKLSFKKKVLNVNEIPEGDYAKEGISDSYKEQGVQEVAPILDTKAALKGLWQFVDTAFVMGASMSKGTIEYEKLSDEKLNTLAETCNQSEAMQKLASAGGLSTLVIVGTIIGTFGTAIKYHPNKRHDAKKALQNLCECNKCLKYMKDNAVDAEVINEVPDLYRPQTKTISKKEIRLKFLTREI